MTSIFRLSSIMLSFLLLLLFYVHPIAADGVGLIGLGKRLYNPPCAHACRAIIKNMPILCESGPTNATNAHAGHIMKRQHAHGGPTKPACFLKDRAFLRTMALCINDYCSIDNPSIAVIEDYWTSHLSTGTLGNWSPEKRPIMTYTETLLLVKQEVESTGRDKLPIVNPKWPLNATSVISKKTYTPYYNGYWGFENQENQHTYTSIVIAVLPVGLPILISLLRFIPLPGTSQSRLDAILNKPLWGQRHSEPVVGNIGLMLTRGQALFIAVLYIFNVVLMVFPHNAIQPTYNYINRENQLLGIIGDRVGALAMANFVSIFLFAARNNFLLWITNWSHSTYLLIHRWIAYLCVVQICIHSAMMVPLYGPRFRNTLAAEQKKPYWYWGIIGTLASIFILPFSLLIVRRKMYEVFLIGHQVLAILVLVGTFLHIWYLYAYNWGYEIWVYVGGAIWGIDRVWRFARILRNGIRTAEVTLLEEKNGYMRMTIDGVTADNAVYLTFPTLSWRFWESHPFSVFSSFTGFAGSTTKALSSRSSSDQEKDIQVTTDPVETGSQTSSQIDVRPRLSFLLRGQTGLTKNLLARVISSGGTLRIPVLVESSYHSTPRTHDLASCSTLIGIAGGVGITAVLPTIRQFQGPRARLFWSTRTDAIIKGSEEELSALGRHIDVETVVGSRLPISEILTEELTRADDKGKIGIVVCGPVAMADAVNNIANDLVTSGRAKRGLVLVNETFSW